MLRVTARPDWLDPPVSYPIAAGMTLAEIVSGAPGIPEYMLECCTVAVNGEPVPRVWWDSVRPREGTFADPVIVTIHPPALHGGGGGGGTKQVLTIVASLALVAGTAFIGAGGLATYLGASASLFGSGGTLTAYAASPFGVEAKGGLGTIGRRIAAMKSC